MTGDCRPCKGQGWLRAAGDWTKCEACLGSGEKPVRAPDEILTSSGRVSKGVHWLHLPAKPKPTLGVAAPPAKPRQLLRCPACGGNGTWMAPVYHNERVRETCSTCRGTGTVAR